MIDDIQTDIEKFDRAVFGYLATISSKVLYATTQNAIRTISKREIMQDDQPYNFISFYRNSSFEIDWERMNNPGAIEGDFCRLISRKNVREARYVLNIPVNLTYNVDIWASKSVEVLDMATELITKIYMQDQVLEVPINPEDNDANGRFHILDVSWNDNSDIERETEIGKVYRHTISFTIDARVTLTRDVRTTKLCAIPVNIYE